MNETHHKAGSIWRRWDLHLHAPGTKLSNDFGDPSDQNLAAYLEILEKSEIQVFGITDYFSFDCYYLVVEKYKEFYPSGRKIFFPNIEFRLLETISSDGKNVHTHVLFDPEYVSKSKLAKFLGDLETHITSNEGAVRCNELKTKEDFTQATVSINNLKQTLSKVFPDEVAYMIVTAANNDGLRGVDNKSPRSMSIADELDKASHAFFGSSKNTDHYLKSDRYEDKSESYAKPVFSASDAHSFADLDRLSGDEPDYEANWIKADLTFRGLRQTLFEPVGRVHIGERPTVLIRQDREATRFISELRIDQTPGYFEENGSWFKNVVIPLNPELTVIIGNKGSGKSAVADVIALLGESRQQDYFSFLTDDGNNRQFCQKGFAENFIGELEWKSGTRSSKQLDATVDNLKPETVKYLPQNYFESLTNEIEVNAFRREIEEVVFSHVDEADKMGTSSFKALENIKTSQSKKDISDLKVRLRELNIQIVELEKHADPEFKQKLDEELKLKKEELRVLEISKPVEIKKPDGETSEQKLVAGQIARESELLEKIHVLEMRGVDRLTVLKSDLQKLNSIKEAVNRIDSRVSTDRIKLKTNCQELDLDIDQIVKFQADLSSVDTRITKVSAEIMELDSSNELNFSDDTDFNKFVSVPDLRGAHRHISDKIKRLRDTLSAPQKRYQKYLQALTEINSKQKELQGVENNPKSGTIHYLSNRIRDIEDNLQNDLDDKYKRRDELSRSIFTCKERVRQLYEGLKASVESSLTTVSSDEFKVTIDASFVPLVDFSENFLAQINQNVSGFFRGTVEGRSKFKKLIGNVDWTDIESVLKFVNLIINSIKESGIEKQVKDIKYLYDYLFSFEYFDTKYELRLGRKNLNQLSPGEKGLLLLVFYLHLDKEKKPLIIDQAEDNLDNESIFLVLAKCIREAKKTRQVILVTHNPNLAVGADAEQVVYVSLDKSQGYKFGFDTGSIENPKINDAIVKILEGSKPAFVQRRLKYHID